MTRHYGRQIALLLALVVAADQWTKRLIAGYLALHESREVIPGFFHLTHVLNTGAAFGILADARPPVRTLFFIAVAVVALVVLAVAWRHYAGRGRLYAMAVGLIGGGALGNSIDRLRHGAVTDFLDFFIGRYHWPAFNVADSAITVGVACFLLAGFFEERKRSKP